MSKKSKTILYVISILVIQELVFRLVFPFPELSNLNRVDYMHSMVPGEQYDAFIYQNASWACGPDTNALFVHDLNGYGFRDDEWSIEKPANKKRILFLGDSFTEGAMAAEGETIPDRFQEMAGEEFEVMNAGVIGIGIESYIQMVERLVPLYKPDEVILVLYANDITVRPFKKTNSDWEPEYYNVMLPRFVALLTLLSGDKVLPLRWQPSRPFIPAVPDPGNLFTTKEAQYAPHVTPEIAEYMKEGLLNFHRTNWVLKEEAFLKKSLSIKKHLQYIQQFLRQNNTQFTVAYIPSRHQVSSYYYPFELPFCRQLCPEKLDMSVEAYQVHRSLLYSDCDALGVSFIDTYGKIKDAEMKDIHLYWKYDDHMRERGYRLVANTLFEHWSE